MDSAPTCVKRGIAHTIPEKADQQRHRYNRVRRGGTPPRFDRQIYRRRNMIEHCFNRLKGFRGIATRYEKTATPYEAGGHARVIPAVGKIRLKTDPSS